jgi:2-polyprenyl-6-methoxyphenol hydroxylase-like FAD-dependent oxidoreductase
MIFVAPSPPRFRGGATFPIEDSRRRVTLFGLHGDHPPTDPDGLTEFAASLPIPHFERLLDTQPWVTEEINHYPFPANIRRHYEDFDRFPDGLLVIGDALASFNPIYGQGMSVAALEAVVLHHTLADGSRENLAFRFFDRTEEIIDTAWTLAVSGDFAFSQTEGPKPRGTDVINSYLSRLRQKAHNDEVLRDVFGRVLMMERPPMTLFHPRIMWRVMKPTP